MDQYKNIKIIIRSNKIEGIIFDFEGTLFILDIDWEKLKKTLFQLKILDSPDARLGSIMVNLRKNNSVLYNKGLSIIKEFEFDAYSRGEVNKELIDLIKLNRDKKMGIYTMNTRAIIERFITQNSLEALIDSIVSIDNMYEPKPSSHDLEKIRSQWELSTERIIYIGNSKYDAYSGKLAKIQTILVNQ